MGDKVADELHEVLLAEPRGFCAGVDRAIEIVERALKKFGAPIYVRHEIVHNTYVVNDLKAKGAIFIEDVADVLNPMQALDLPWLESADIANAVLWLCSDEARGITGVSLPVDGGNLLL